MPKASSDNSWFYNRVVISAGFFFGDTAEGRKRLDDWRKKNSKPADALPASDAECREALGVTSGLAWTQFLVEFVNQATVIRVAGPCNWSDAGK